MVKIVGPQTFLYKILKSNVFYELITMIKTLFDL